MRSTTNLCCSESCRLPTTAISSPFFRRCSFFLLQAADYVFESGFSESHLRGRWCSSVFLPIDESSSKRSGLLFFFSSSAQLRRLPLIFVPWSSASGPLRHSTRTLNYYDLSVPGRRLVDKGAASDWAASRSIKTPPRSARPGLPLGSRTNTAPGPHVHSRPAPTGRWDLPRF